MKKCLIFLLALIVILSGTLIGCSCENGDGEPSGETMGTIDVPGGGKIKVVSKLPAELKLTLEELGIDSFFCPILSGKIKNVSQYTVSYDKISFVLDGEEITRTIGETLEPGEETAFYKGPIVGPNIMQTAKILEVKAVNFQIIGGSTEAPEEPTTPESEITPEEVLIKWFDLMKKEKFSEAEKLFTPDYKKYTDSYGGLEKVWQENPMTEIRILRTQDTGTDTVNVYVVIIFEDGTVYDDDSKAHFEKINNEWKIDSFSE